MWCPTLGVDARVNSVNRKPLGNSTQILPEIPCKIIARPLRASPLLTLMPAPSPPAPWALKRDTLGISATSGCDTNSEISRFPRSHILRSILEDKCGARVSGGTGGTGGTGFGELRTRKKQVDANSNMISLLGSFRRASKFWSTPNGLLQPI